MENHVKKRRPEEEYLDGISGLAQLSDDCSAGFSAGFDFGDF